MDGARIAGKEAQAAARGIFPRDPTLKDFLRDKPACLVTLRCIWNYARRRTASETRAVLENYVVHGGDEGLTRIAARTSCNLPVEAEQSVDILEVALAGIDDASNPPPQQIDELERSKKAQTLEHNKFMAEIKTWLQSKGKDWFTSTQIKNAKKNSFSFARAESAAVIEKLAVDGYLLSESRELPKAGKSTIYLPRISTKTALDAVIPLRPDEHLTCMEEYKWSATRSRMSPESSRTLNLGTLTTAYGTKEGTTRKRGAPTKKKGTEQEEHDKLAEDLAAVAAREAAFFLEILKLVEIDICKRKVLRTVLVSREQSAARRHATSICMLQCSPLPSSLPIRYNPRISTSRRGERWRLIGRKSVRIRCNALNTKANRS